MARTKRSPVPERTLTSFALHFAEFDRDLRDLAVEGVVALSEIGPIWTINQQAKSLKSLASTLAIVGKFRSV